jgi:hypothetical protein
MWQNGQLSRNLVVNLYTKISEKKICIQVGISTRDQYPPRLKSSHSAIHHPLVLQTAYLHRSLSYTHTLPYPLRQWPFFLFV